LERRWLLRSAAALPVLVAARHAAVAEPTGTPFSPSTVHDFAQDLAGKPFQPQTTELPSFLSKLSYDQYRMLRFDKAHALWRGMRIPYQVEFNHRGFIYSGRVDVDEVVDGHAAPVPYRPDMFDFGSVQRPTNEDLGFAGFRLHAPINRPSYYDEVCSFLGASYFRAVAKGLGYGLSARGLAIKTADPSGEEFPYFKKFWIVRPAAGTKPGPITVYAVLDSPSATASFRFIITPGVDTVFDTQMTVFPRVDIAQIGIAPLTSMFFFDSNDRNRTDDWRPAVHDSDGLLMQTGRGETLWRALANPRTLQVSSFADRTPRGFGLMQRKRSFADYQDLESHYENRPSCWVEPVGDWGEGAVVLVEIPTDRETNDNIVAFWRPKPPLQAKVPYDFAYRLHWSGGAPLKAPAPFTATMVGLGDNGTRTFVLNIGGLKADVKPRLDVTSDKGKLLNPLMQPDPEQGGWRISFDLDPGRETTVELHGRLMQADTPLTETWMYRWTT
jgi:glucans biosynthesis protein